jgi:hypothetical protein
LRETRGVRGKKGGRIGFEGKKRRGEKKDI